MVKIIQGDCRAVLKTLPAASVHCCVTSPPYWGLRDYGVAGQMGLERTPDLYVGDLVAVFREVWRVLRPDGTLWINLGDSYVGSRRNPGQAIAECARAKRMTQSRRRDNEMIPRSDISIIGLKPKDMVGIPWRMAFALQDDGWWLRQDIIWHKPNPMPESVADRPTKTHEYIFLLAKSAKYYYDAEAIKVPASEATHARISQNLAAQVGSFRANGGNKTNGPMKAVIAGSTRKMAEAGSGIKNNQSFEAAMALKIDRVNKRSVWTVATQSYHDAHFATFPPALITPCILAGCPEGGTVLDPFGGSGTTGLVAETCGRNSILIELKPEYCEMARQRTAQQGLFCSKEAK